MSHSKHHYLALVPLLSLLAMSPAQIETKSVSRSLASFVDEKPVKEEKPFPLYTELVGKINRQLIKIDKDISKDVLENKVSAYKDRLKLEIKDLKKSSSNKEEVVIQQKKSQDLVVDLAIFEEEKKVLQEKKLLDEAEVKIADLRLNEMKSDLEEILSSIESNKKLAEKPVEEKKEVVVASSTPAKKETKKEEVKKEVAEEKKEEKKAVKRSENPEICALQEQNDTLSKELKDLMGEQKKISESLVNLTGALTQLVQNQQRNPWAQFMSGPMPMLAYPQQYPTPQNMGGQWVYMNGAQPVSNAQNMGDQTLAQAMQYQAIQQNNQQLNGPFVYNNGLGSNPFSIQLPSTQGQTNLSYEPLNVAPQFQVGNFGQSSQFNNIAVNFSPSSLMVM